MRELTYDGVPGTACLHLIPPEPSRFVAWATSQPDSCYCGLPIDWWYAVRKCYIGVGAVFMAHAPMGGATLSAIIDLHAGEFTYIDLDTLGLPVTATVRDIGLTPMGDGSSRGTLWPALMTGNRVRQSPLSHKFSVYPAPQGEDPVETQKVSIHVQYTDAAETTSRSLLVEATSAHVDKDYRKSIIEAHTAADLALQAACAAQFPDLTDVDLRSMNFAAKITCLAAAREVTVRPEFLARARSLNAQRNKVAHPRSKHSPLSQEEAAEHLATAVFMVYLAEGGATKSRSD